jgi:hypothetical protein
MSDGAVCYKPKGVQQAEVFGELKAEIVYVTLQPLAAQVGLEQAQPNEGRSKACQGMLISSTRRRRDIELLGLHINTVTNGAMLRGDDVDDGSLARYRAH